MTVKRATTVTQPYKFLDYYEFEDRYIFFGRERETEILLSDVIATRLVVLFAKTGTGKTSLINAGVRPRLEELDYATFYIRVEKDPAESVRKALREQNLLPSQLEGQSLAIQLEHAVTQLDKPTVVFFDQFEEFFIYIFNEDPEKAHQFISDIAQVYRNRESGVHVVFSMREEFFVEMDAFRDEIPSIFHNDSNLRLHWFDKDQAREVIVGPARKFETEIDEKLVDRLIRDLAEGGRIEPARLQIVCDTLWWQRTDERIRLDDYEELGGAERILDRRLGEDIDQHLDAGQLQLFEKLLPKLSTERGTKYVRGFDELVETLTTDELSLRELVDQLKGLSLIRESTRYKAIYIEWTSDYLAERTDYLQKRVRAIALRRLLKAAMDRAESKKTELAEKYGPRDIPWIEVVAKEDLEALYMAPGDFKAFSEGAHLLEKSLSQAEAEFLFLAALEHGTYMSLWFEKAAENGVKVWKILRDRVINEHTRIGQAENAVRLLGELGTEQVLELLGIALQRDALAALTVIMLSWMEKKGVVELLESALHQKHLAPQAERALDRISESRTAEAEVKAKARSVLDRWRQDQGIAQPRRAPMVEHERLLTARGLLEEHDWALLLRRIKDGKCTPFLGAGVNYGVLPLGSEIAQQWAQEYLYPLEDARDLGRVAQFLAMQYDPIFPKEKILRLFENVAPPDFIAPDEPYGVLADLPLPVYMTTNYDDFMVQALKSRNKDPKQELCRWNQLVKDRSSVFDAGFMPTVANPVVFHLHGHNKVPESLVLTEDDYLDFLVNISRDPALLPVRIQMALAGSSLLFIGYSLADWTFRVLFRGPVTATEPALRRISVAVLLPPASTEEQGYMDNYFNRTDLRVYWGTAREFAAELRRRWEEFHYGT